MQQASRCQNCGSPVGAGQRFCGVCGAMQSTGCPYCGSAVDPGSRFCPNCGAPAGGGQQQQGGWGQQQPGWDQQQQGGWGQQQPGWDQQQQGGWGQQQPQQTGWGQQQGGWGQQQPGWGQQQPGWGQPAQKRSSPMFLVLILVVLLVALGGFTLWQFGPRFGIDIAGMFSGTKSTSSKPDTTKPVISSIESTTDHKSALITWITDDLSSSQVEYGTDTSYGTLMPTTPATDPSYKDPATGNYTSLGVTTHDVEIAGLDADTTYHFRVKSKNKDGLETVSADNTFKTTAIPEDTE